MTETMHAVIDYGCGTADLWGPFDKKTVRQAFHDHANQCFGIRKSIMGFRLQSIDEEALPQPWSKLPGATVVLKHSGDTIVWGSDGEKLKSEWD